MIITRLIDIPVEIRGFTLTDNDGNYNIYINARLSQAGQEKAYVHEINHIENGHFETDKHITEIENPYFVMGFLHK